MTDLYWVVGNPIAHSKSPLIHAEFAKQTGQALSYQAQLIELGEFDAEVAQFFVQGGKGMNVTVPFKEDAFRFADLHSERALKAKAVNTLKRLEDGRIYADNTDGAGLVRDISVNQGISLQGKRVLLLGAGGAVRGVLQPLLAEQPAELVIANRTVSKAQALADDFASLGKLSACGFSEVSGQFDLVINGTSASLSGELPPLPSTLFHEQSVSYDMMYGQGLTVFNQWAQGQGVSRTLDGLGMLVEQAAEAFYLWRGVRPETSAVTNQLRQGLGV